MAKYAFLGMGVMGSPMASNMVKSAIRYRIYEVFNENNIEIPFPQRTVWMNKS